MRPFGDNITNISNNGAETGSGAAGAGNGDNNSNDNGRNSNANSDNGSLDLSSAEMQSYLNDPRVPQHIARIGGIVTCSPIAGNGIIRVVMRCTDAKENQILDLSKCELMQIPDAIYHLMRDTELQTCNLSNNVLKRISPKFALKFSALTDINLSHNQLSKLPDEFVNLERLTSLNISNNSFIVLPQVVFKLPKLTNLDVQHNAILELHTDEVIASDCLEVVDLRNNPLSSICRSKLRDFVTSFQLKFSEDLEDDDT